MCCTNAKDPVRPAAWSSAGAIVACAILLCSCKSDLSRRDGIARNYARDADTSVTENEVETVIPSEAIDNSVSPKIEMTGNGSLDHGSKSNSNSEPVMLGELSPHFKGKSFRYVHSHRIDDDTTQTVYLRVDESPRLKDGLVFDTRGVTESMGRIRIDRRSRKVQSGDMDAMTTAWIAPLKDSVAARLVSLVVDGEDKRAKQKVGNSGRQWQFVLSDSTSDYYMYLAEGTKEQTVLLVEMIALTTTMVNVYMRPEDRVFAPCDYDHWGNHEPIVYRPMRSGEAEDKILQFATKVGLLDE